MIRLDNRLNYVNLTYLESFCLLKLREVTPDISREIANNVLARALMHPNYESLKNTYDVSEKKRVFKKEDAFLDRESYNITERGFFFSPYYFQDELTFTRSNPFELKTCLDSIINGPRFYNGNIRLTSPEQIHVGLEGIKKGKQVRLMGDWPLKFYCRRYDELTLQYKSGDFFREPVFYMDDFTIESFRYFKGQKYLNHYVKWVIDEFVLSGNLLLSNSLTKIKAKCTGLPIQIILDNYRCHFVYLTTAFGRRKTILLPRQFPQLKIPDQDSFASWLKKARKLRFLTQSELEDISGVSERTIRNLEKGEYLPRMDSLALLVKALKVKPYQFGSE